MNKGSTLDFTSFNQDGLEQALRNINRDKYPENYAACVAEIERRKAAGEWATEMRKAAPTNLARDSRIAKIAAVLVCAVIAVLIVFGIYKFPKLYPPEMRKLTAQIQSNTGAVNVVYSQAKDGADEIPSVSVFFPADTLNDAAIEAKFSKIAPLIMNSDWGKGKHSVKVSVVSMPTLTAVLNSSKFQEPVSKVLHY